MTRHFDAELQGLKTLILSMGGCVERAVELSCQAILKRRSADFKQVHDQEAQVNKLHMEVDLACLNLLAKQAPVARDLRLVMAIIKINTDLERMGDQAVNMSHNGKDFLERQPISYSFSDFEKMSKAVREMVRASLDAFVRGDVKLSQEVLNRDDEVDQFRDKIFSEIKSLMSLKIENIEAGLDMILIARNLERLADHATNIAEEVIFIMTGDDVRHGHQSSLG